MFSIGCFCVPLANNRPSADCRSLTNTEDPHQFSIIDAFLRNVNAGRTVDRYCLYEEVYADRMSSLSKHLRHSAKIAGMLRTFFGWISLRGTDGALGNCLGMTLSRTNVSIREEVTRYFCSCGTGRDNTPSEVRRSASTFWLSSVILVVQEIQQTDINKDLQLPRLCHDTEI